MPTSQNVVLAVLLICAIVKGKPETPITSGGGSGSSSHSSGQDYSQSSHSHVGSHSSPASYNSQGVRTDYRPGIHGDTSFRKSAFSGLGVLHHREAANIPTNFGNSYGGSFRAVGPHGGVFPTYGSHHSSFNHNPHFGATPSPIFVSNTGHFNGLTTTYPSFGSHRVPFSNFDSTYKGGVRYSGGNFGGPLFTPNPSIQTYDHNVHNSGSYFQSSGYQPGSPGYKYFRPDPLSFVGSSSSPEQDSSGGGLKVLTAWKTPGSPLYQPSYQKPSGNHFFSHHVRNGNLGSDFGSGEGGGYSQSSYPQHGSYSHQAPSYPASSPGSSQYSYQSPASSNQNSYPQNNYPQSTYSQSSSEYNSQSNINPFPAYIPSGSGSSAEHTGPSSIGQDNRVSGPSSSSSYNEPSHSSFSRDGDFPLSTSSSDDFKKPSDPSLSPSPGPPTPYTSHVHSPTLHVQSSDAPTGDHGHSHGHSKATSYQSFVLHTYKAVPVYLKKGDLHHLPSQSSGENQSESPNTSHSSS